MELSESEKDNFEKIYLLLKNTPYEESDVAIANCPDNWSLCSFNISAWHGYKNKFIHLLMNKEETTKIRDALTSVIEDM